MFYCLVTLEYIKPNQQWSSIYQMSFADFNGIAVSDNGPIVVTLMTPNPTEVLRD